MVKVKICGNHRSEDISILQQYEHSIDYIGFIFTKASKRYVSPQRVKLWMQTYPFLFQKAVAVCLDQDLPEVKNILQQTGISHVQLHGNESVDYCQTLKKEYNGIEENKLKIWKVVAIEDRRLPAFESYLQVVDGILLDTKLKGVSGGTGQPFDWSLIPLVKQILTKYQLPLFIAGGISSNNVSKLLTSYELDGIDLASGVETELAKDEQKLLTLLEGVKLHAGRKE